MDILFIYIRHQQLKHFLMALMQHSLIMLSILQLLFQDLNPKHSIYQNNDRFVHSTFGQALVQFIIV